MHLATASATLTNTAKEIPIELQALVSDSLELTVFIIDLAYRIVLVISSI